MWKWLKTKFSMQPKPVIVNATGSERALRNQERIKRLQLLIERGDPRESVKEELKRRLEKGR